MPLWRIRFSDRHGATHAIYYELDHAPNPHELQRAMREHMLNLHSKKDGAQATGAEAEGITFQGIDKLPD